MKYLLSFFIFIILFSVPSKADEYDLCILKNMKGVTSDAAAKSIERACYNLYKKEESSKKKYYFKDVCTRKENYNYDLGDAKWDDEYFQNFVVTITNKNSFTVWAQFLYAKKGSKLDSDFIASGDGGNVFPNSTGVFKIREDKIIYADEGFTYKFKVTYEDCKKVKVEY